MTAIFSYHRHSKHPLLLVMAFFFGTPETILLHLLVQHWSEPVAWFLTLGSLYTLIWLVGDYHASRLHPILVDREWLHLRSGLRWRLSFPLGQVERVERLTRPPRKAPDYLALVPPGDEPRLLLTLAQPITGEGLFGIQRTVRRVGLMVNDEQGFLALLQHSGGQPPA